MTSHTQIPLILIRSPPIHGAAKATLIRGKIVKKLLFLIIKNSHYPAPSSLAAPYWKYWAQRSIEIICVFMLTEAEWIFMHNNCKIVFSHTSFLIILPISSFQFCNVRFSFIFIMKCMVMIP